LVGAQAVESRINKRAPKGALYLRLIASQPCFRLMEAMPATIISETSANCPYSLRVGTELVADAAPVYVKEIDPFQVPVALPQAFPTYSFMPVKAIAGEIAMVLVLTVGVPGQP